MPREITIHALDDLRLAIDEALDSPANETFNLVLDQDLKFTIKMEGDTWDGLVDVRVAKFVTELQRSYERVRKAAELPGDEKALVKVEIKDGSTELEPQILQLFGDALRNMNSQQQFVILLVFMGVVFAGWSLRAILAHLKAKNDAAAANATVRELNQTIQYALEKLDPEKPIRTLINSMEENDRIRLPAEGTLTKEEAKTRYPRRPRVTPVDAIIDDNYQVESVSLENQIKFTLTKGDYSFRALLARDITQDDTDAFLARVKTAIETRTSMRVALQIDASIGDKAVTAAAIVGIGRAPRDGAEDLTSFFE